jgi:predicted glycosyltransferase
MPLFMIERNFAEQLQLTEEAVAGANEVIAEAGNTWLCSFLSADKKKMYCLYEAPNPETILAAAERLGIPADVILPVDEIRPGQLTSEP